MEKEHAVRITWLGHACFKVEFGEYAVVIDPYQDDYVPGFGAVRETAQLVLCSHDHADHNFAEAVKIEPRESSPLQVTKIEVFHDDREGSLRGKSTIHILDDGVLRVAHLGDIGCELTAEQKKELSGLDAVMIPVGGFYTIDAAQAKKLVDEILPKVVIPMHYRGENFGYDVLGTVDQFTDLCELVVNYPGAALEVSKETQPHVAVLTYEKD